METHSSEICVCVCERETDTHTHPYTVSNLLPAYSCSHFVSVYSDQRGVCACLYLGGCVSIKDNTKCLCNLKRVGSRSPVNQKTRPASLSPMLSCGSACDYFNLRVFVDVMG